MPFADVDKVAKQIPAALDMTLDKALEENETLRQMEQTDPKVKELLSVARRLEGMTRHASVHAAGVVIAPRAITEYAPLYRGAHDEIVTQWSMKDIERVGLLKMDFLGLSTLTLIDDAIKEIERTTGEQLDIDRVPLDDAKTYQIFQDGQTYGIFQFESSGMRDILRKAKPQSLEDLIALERAVPPRSAAQRHGRRFHRAQGWEDRDQVRAAAARADPGRNLRRHRLSGAGDAHRARARAASRSAKPTSCARRWARRTRRHAGAARRSSSTARRKAGSPRRRPGRSSI